MGEMWERFEETGESAKAFDAFRYYRDLPGHQRSIRNAAAVSLGHSLPIDPQSLPANDRRILRNRKDAWDDFSLRNEWVNRANAWDAHLDEIRRGDQVVALREMRDRHARIGRLFVDAAETALDRITKARVIGKAEDKVVLAYAAEGMKMERGAYGLEDGAPIEIGESGPQEVARRLLTGNDAVALKAVEFQLAVHRAEREAKAAEEAKQ